MGRVRVVDVVNSLAFGTFFLFLFIGTSSTLSRLVYYRSHGYRRPKLLIRDAWMIGGFSLSFGLILIARVLRASGVDVSSLSTNLLWTLATAIPAIIAVGVYAYFEVAVIERGRDEVRDETYGLRRADDE